MQNPVAGAKVAVITGSTGGMGAGIAGRLARDGMAVVITGRRDQEGEQVAEDIRHNGAQAVFVHTDVSIEADCMGLVRAAVTHFGRLDVLVNNAAITPVEPPGEQSVALWDDVFAVNVRGAFVCCREAIPIMRAQGGGRIINIGSTLPFRGGLERLAYGCSKGALLTLTKSLARGLVRDHILVNWIAVGWVATPGEVFLRNKTHGDGSAFLEESGQKSPLGRLETVEDIANGVAYLASDESSHVTGCELNISGGRWIA